MRKSRTEADVPKVLKLAAVLLLCLNIVPESLAQGAGPCGSDPVAFAQNFLRAIYPEIREKGNYMYLSASGPFKQPWSILNEYSVHVKEYPDNTAPAAIVDGPRLRLFENVEVAGAFLMCSPEGIFKFAGAGSVTGTDQWEAFKKAADTHPEWTQEQAIGQLKAAGARYYGPDQKEPFLKQVPWGALRTYIGKFETKSAEFVVHQEEGEHPRYDLMWVIDLESQPAPNKRQTYALFFEPFRGKLYLLSTMGPEPSKHPDRSKVTLPQ